MRTSVQIADLSRLARYGVPRSLQTFFEKVVKHTDRRLSLVYVLVNATGFWLDCHYTPSNSKFGEQVSIRFEITRQAGMGTGYVMDATVSRLPKGIEIGSGDIPRVVARPRDLIVWDRHDDRWMVDPDLSDQFEPIGGHALDAFGRLLSGKLEVQLDHLRTALLEANDIS